MSSAWILDASALVDALLDSRRSDLLARVSATGPWAAPATVDAEVASALRGLARSRRLAPERAGAALGLFARMPLERVLVTPLLGRVWELRDRLSAYDGCYVALAERLGGTLVTADDGLARAARALEVPVLAL